jgi:hypothetical protein
MHCETIITDIEQGVYQDAAVRHIPTTIYAFVQFRLLKLSHIKLRSRYIVSNRTRIRKT